MPFQLLCYGLQNDANLFKNVNQHFSNYLQAEYYEASLECQIKAYPAPAIRWKKDGESVVNDGNHKITHYAAEDELVTTTLQVNRQQLSPLLDSIDIWPARNSRLTQRGVKRITIQLVAQASQPGATLLDACP